MPPLTPRLAAGVGVLSVFLLLAGPGPVTHADPGGGHHDRGNSSHRDHGPNRGGPKGPAGRDHDNRKGLVLGNGSNKKGGGANNANNSASNSRGSVTTTTGNGREPLRGSEPGGAQRAGQTPPASRVGSGRDVALVPDDGSVASDGSGAPGASGPTVPAFSRAGQFQAPRVTFGNGRTPGGEQIGESEPNWRAPVFSPAPAAEPPPPPPPPPPPISDSWTDRIYHPPAPAKQLGIAPTSNWADPLWGIAGLLLIPAAGAALGYRQARAAQAAERLRKVG